MLRLLWLHAEHMGQELMHALSVPNSLKLNKKIILLPQNHLLRKALWCRNH
jgi:hypothetical protein